MFPIFLGEQVPSETLAATLAELDVNLRVLEDKFLQDKAFLVGPHISLADLVAITEVMHVSALKERARKIQGVLASYTSPGLANPR